jgi:iron complex transport system substrate-binding protein
MSVPPFPSGDSVNARRPIRARQTSSRQRAVVPALLIVIALIVAACGGTIAASPAPPDPTQEPPPVATPAPAATPAATPATAFPVTLQDDDGVAVTIPAEPMRIVSLTPAATETLFALGVGDRLVGKVEDWSLYPPEAADVPDVAQFGSVDIERIVALEADLVIAGGNNFNPAASITQLRALGIPTLVVFAPDVATAIADIELIGRAVGRSEEAAAITADLQAAFDEVAAATRGLPPPRVFYELDASSGIFGPAPDYFGTEMIRLAGGDPLTSGTPGVYQIQVEQIVDFDPEIILLGDAAYGVTPEQVAARAGWEGLTAVRTGEIRAVDDVIITRPGPRLGDGLRALALAIHPDAPISTPAP